MKRISHDLDHPILFPIMLITGILGFILVILGMCVHSGLIAGVGCILFIVGWIFMCAGMADGETTYQVDEIVVEKTSINTIFIMDGIVIQTNKIRNRDVADNLTSKKNVLYTSDTFFGTRNDSIMSFKENNES